MADSPRWCAYCKSYGEHHTDRHNLYVGKPVEETFRIMGVDHTIRDGVLLYRDGDQWLRLLKPKPSRRQRVAGFLRLRTAR